MIPCQGSSIDWLNKKTIYIYISSIFKAMENPPPNLIILYEGVYVKVINKF